MCSLNLFPPLTFHDQPKPESRDFAVLSYRAYWRLNYLPCVLGGACPSSFCPLEAALDRDPFLLWEKKADIFRYDAGWRLESWSTRALSKWLWSKQPLFMQVQPMERQKCNQRPMRTCLKRNAGAGLPSRGGREVKSPERTLGESEAHPVIRRAVWAPERRVRRYVWS